MRSAASLFKTGAGSSKIIVHGGGIWNGIPDRKAALDDTLILTRHLGLGIPGVRHRRRFVAAKIHIDLLVQSDIIYWLNLHLLVKSAKK
jgi:hypothetical protein